MTQTGYNGSDFQSVLSMPTNTTKATAQPLPIIAPPQVPQTVGGITTVSASVAPPVISSQTNAGQ